MKRILIPAILMISACTCPSPEQLVDELYAKMTPGERIAQLHGIYLNQFFKEDGTLDTLKCQELIPDGAGHFSQYASQLSWEPDQTRDRVAVMQDWLIHNTPNGIPALFHEEALTGICTRGATVYPQQIGQACSFNTELAEEKTVWTGRNLRKIGAGLALSPMVDVVRNPSFNRLEESYGEDAYLSAAMGKAFVSGLQMRDKDGSQDYTVGACSKHFLGYGGGGDADVKERMEEIIYPHESIIREAGSHVVMTGYHKVDGVDCVASSYLQEDILRNYLGFDGMMVSDYGSINQINAYGNNLERGAAAINAGNDVDFPTGDSYRYLYEAIDQGLVDEATFERAVKRVLLYKAKFGLLSKNPHLYESGHIEFDTECERQLAYDIASQSVVLLKNEGALPIAKEKKVLLTGPNANSMWAMLGDYTFHSMRFFWQRQVEDDMHPKIVTLKEGLERLGCDMEYVLGCEWTDKVETIIEDGGDERAAYMRSIQGRMLTHEGETADLNAALKAAKDCDMIVAAVGENVILCGENRDRTSLRLPGKQENYVRQLIATGKPVVLVVFGGRAQVISGIADRCAAVIQAWYPGEEGGNAVADILCGKVNPSGKLSVSYPAKELNRSVCYNRSLSKDPDIEWEFGYGLSYTAYEYSDIKVETENICTDTEAICVSCNVSNTGDMAGEEIVQLYVSPSHADSKPIQLKGFARVSLEPGECKRVVFTLNPDSFAYFVEDEGAIGHWEIKPGSYTIKLGASSQDIRLQEVLELKGAPVRKPLRDALFSIASVD